MRIETNHKLVRRNRRIAQYLFFFSMGALAAAFIAANAQAFSGSLPDPDTLEGKLALILPTLVLPIGVLASLFSVRMTNLWIREPRPERAIQDGSKGLSNKSVLYNYYHIPARHVLICPQGVYAITTRFQDGHFTVNGDQWTTRGGPFSGLLRIMRRDGIGNPGQDARRSAEHVQKLLDPIVSDIEVRPVVLFIDPRATVKIEKAELPILFADPKQQPNLKDFLRDVPQADRQPMTPEQIEAFEAATLAN